MHYPHPVKQPFNLVTVQISKYLSSATSDKGGAHTHSEAYIVHMSSALNGSSALQRFEHGNDVKMHTQDCHMYICIQKAKSVIFTSFMQETGIKATS